MSSGRSLGARGLLYRDGSIYRLSLCSTGKNATVENIIILNKSSIGITNSSLLIKYLMSLLNNYFLLIIGSSISLSVSPSRVHPKMKTTKKALGARNVYAYSKELVIQFREAAMKGVQSA